MNKNIWVPAVFFWLSCLLLGGKNNHKPSRGLFFLGLLTTGKSIGVFWLVDFTVKLEFTKEPGLKLKLKLQAQAPRSKLEVETPC